MKKTINEQDAILIIASCISSNNNFTIQDRKNNIKCLKTMLNFFKLPIYLRQRCIECIVILEKEISEDKTVYKKYVEEYSKKI